MRKNHLQFLVVGGIISTLVFSLVPTFSGADPDLPDEALVRAIPADDPFPHQVELAARVNFWRHVFGVWGRRQVALHDMDNPGLVYEVLTVPESSANHAVDRNEFVRKPFEELVHRLHTLEQKVARGDELDADEQELLNKFRTIGGISQLPGAHDRVRVQYGVREKFLEGIKVSGRYDAVFRRIFRAHGVPEDLAFLPHVESSFQVNARSGVGAVGIWQFTLPAAKSFMHVNNAVDERYDPVLAAEGCARYLAHAHEELGDWGLAITAYNHGVGGMMKARSEFGTDFPRILNEYEGALFGFDSRNFYVEFLAARDVARHAEQYFGSIHREAPLSWEKVALDHSESIYKVARDYGVTLAELTEMNTALTARAARGRVPLPEGTSVWLPAGTTQRVAMRSTEDENPANEQPIRVVRAPRSGETMVASISDAPLSMTLRRNTNHSAAVDREDDAQDADADSGNRSDDDSDRTAHPAKNAKTVRDEDDDSNRTARPAKNAKTVRDEDDDSDRTAHPAKNAKTVRDEDDDSNRAHHKAKALPLSEERSDRKPARNTRETAAVATPTAHAAKREPIGKPLATRRGDAPATAKNVAKTHAATTQKKVPEKTAQRATSGASIASHKEPEHASKKGLVKTSISSNHAPAAVHKKTAAKQVMATPKSSRGA